MKESTLTYLKCTQGRFSQIFTHSLSFLKELFFHTHPIVRITMTMGCKNFDNPGLQQPGQPQISV